MYSGLQEHVTIKCIVGKDFIVAVNDYPKFLNTRILPHVQIAHADLLKGVSNRPAGITHKYTRCQYCVYFGDADNLFANRCI